MKESTERRTEIENGREWQREREREGRESLERQ